MVTSFGSNSSSDNTFSVPLLRPVLPTTEQLLGYLSRIDANSHYTNFGPLHNDFLDQVLAIQENIDGFRAHGVLTSNATTGLELALAALDLPAGSKVALPALTFVATATAVRRCGLEPYLVDVDKENWQLTPEQIPNDIQSQGVHAIIPVATYGLPQNAETWRQWQSKTGIPVVIDAAAAFGVQKTAPGITTVFSFHATKPLSTGEGGMVVCHDQQMALRLRCMTNFGIGWPETTNATNAKLSEYHAAVGLAHLQLWPEQFRQRQALLKRYRQALAPGIGRWLDFQKNVEALCPSVLTIRVHTAAHRQHIETACLNNKIQTRRWYHPLLNEQAMLGIQDPGLRIPVARDLSTTLLGLPFFLGMTEEQLEKVSAAVLCEPDPHCGNSTLKMG